MILETLTHQNDFVEKCALYNRHKVALRPENLIKAHLFSFHLNEFEKLKMDRIKIGWGKFADKSA